jgi:hypothetical protein
MTTFVTALFDLAKREGTQRRPATDYLELGRLILEQPIQIVLYIESHLVHHIHVDPKRVRIVVMELEELPLYTHMDKIANAIEGVERSLLKETKLYHLVTASKFELIRRTIKLDPFRSDNFAWIDIGLGHVSNVSGLALLAPPRYQVKLMLRGYLALTDSNEPTQYMRHMDSKVCGGLMYGHREPMTWMADRFDHKYYKFLSKGITGMEECILTLIGTREPERFQFYYGGWCDLVRNANRALYNFDHILNIASLYRVGSQNHKTYECLMHIAVDGKISPSDLPPMSIAQLFRFYDELFICSFHTGRIQLATQAATEMLRAAKTSPPMGRMVKTYYAHLKNNFQFTVYPNHPKVAIIVTAQNAQWNVKLWNMANELCTTRIVTVFTDEQVVEDLDSLKPSNPRVLSLDEFKIEEFDQVLRTL